ncbi:MAG: OsmC family peroxiredoxin, partial [Acidobacteriaceae bacterium]|nr:OsmC family peroxiredoxin [Acidobacteriaceae bacterium]
MIRSATATWKGSPAAGEGSVSTTSGIISKALYSFGSSTGNEPCTSPSEMLAAAVASCMSLIITQELAKLGVRTQFVKTESELMLEEHKGHWQISNIELRASTTLPERDEEKFRQACKAAKTKCPISRALNVPVKVIATL